MHEVFDFHSPRERLLGEFYSLLYSPEVSIVANRSTFLPVKKTGKRQGRAPPSEASCWFDDIARPTKSTRFTSPGGGGDSTVHKKAVR